MRKSSTALSLVRTPSTSAALGAAPTPAQTSAQTPADYGAPPHFIAAHQRDPLEWRQGRGRYAVWVLAVREPAILRRVAQLRRQLAPWLWWGPRQLHITLQVCGFLPEPAWQTAGRPTLADDFSPAMLAGQLDALARLAPRRFSLQVGGLASFDAAAYLRVHDPQDALPALREALALAHGEFRDAPWQPHLTLGHYRQDWPRALLAPLFTSPDEQERQTLVLPVAALDLVSYDARFFTSRLRPLLRHSLGT